MTCLALNHNDTDFNLQVSVPMQTGDMEAATRNSLLSVGGDGGGSSSTSTVYVNHDHADVGADGAWWSAYESRAKRRKVSLFIILQSVIFMITFCKVWKVTSLANNESTTPVATLSHPETRCPFQVNWPGQHKCCLDLTRPPVVIYHRHPTIKLRFHHVPFLLAPPHPSCLILSR